MKKLSVYRKLVAILEEAKDAKPYRSWWNNITEEWKY